ncbi:hypothetical protein [Azospirillum agricola]|uniref:hypothetical protein n=1 Tax=Azospirillum agricola TaxID=1720247 RepID=UPI000A1CA8E8|nr:hypothetical protein [Azospirillum agricola]
MAINPETTVRKIVSIPRELWDGISDYRFDQRMNTEAEAIRRLLQLGLAAQKAGYAVKATGEICKKDE